MVLTKTKIINLSVFEVWLVLASNQTPALWNQRDINRRERERKKDYYWESVLNNRAVVFQVRIPFVNPYCELMGHDWSCVTAIGAKNRQWPAIIYYPCSVFLLGF